MPHDMPEVVRLKGIHRALVEVLHYVKQIEHAGSNEHEMRVDKQITLRYLEIVLSANEAELGMAIDAVK